MLVNEIINEIRSSFKELYHCSPAKNLSSILENGLDPNRSRVYKSVFLAVDIYQAQNYANSYHSDGPWVILAVNVNALDKTLLEPDGDDLPDILRNRGIYDKTYRDYTWQKSLRMAGQCSYAGVVPPSAIRVIK